MRLAELYGWTPEQVSELTPWQIIDYLAGSETTHKRQRWDAATPFAREMMRELEGFSF